MTIAEDIAALQQRLRAAERERVRAEGARDAALASRANAQAELKKQFGVDTVEDASALHQQLKQELAGIVSDLSAKLDEIGV
jgi:hypothetical protein